MNNTSNKNNSVNLLEKQKKNQIKTKETEGPCFKCTQMVPFNDYDKHIEQCDYKQCNYCINFFPEMIIREHLK